MHQNSTICFNGNRQKIFEIYNITVTNTQWGNTR